MTRNPYAYDLSPPGWYYDPPDDPEPEPEEDVEEPYDEEPEPWDGPEDYGVIDDSDFP